MTTGLDPLTRVDTSLGIAAVYDDTDYASLSAAVADIGSARGTLRISTALFPNGATVTVPATLTLEFTGAGTLTITTGQAVTILSDGSHWPIRKLFFNALSGQGTILFTGNNQQKDFWVEWWGAVGDNSTDDTAALNAAFVAWPHGTTMRFSPHKTYRNTGITIDHKFQVTLYGNDSLDGYADNDMSPTLTYTGTNGGTHLTLNNVYGCTFRGFRVYGAVSSGATGAAKNILLTFTAGGTPGLTSQCVFQSIFIHANNTRSDYIGLDISNVSGANNEHHRITDSKFFGATAYPSQTGTGIYLGHSNVKHIRVERTSFTFLAKGVDSLNGSFRGLNNTWTENGIMYAGVYSDTFTAIGDDSEGNVQVVKASGFGLVPMVFLGGRFGSLRGGQVASGSSSTAPVIEIPAGFEAVTLSVDGCLFDCGGSKFTSDFIKNIVSGSIVNWGINKFSSVSGSPAYVVMSVNDLLKGFQTFAQFTRAPMPQINTGSGFMVGGDPANLQYSYQGITSSRSTRYLLGVQADDYHANYNLRVGAKDSIVLDDQASIEIGGLARPVRPDLAVVGTAGAITYQINIIARDANGNRAMPSNPNQNFSTANATLTGSNYVQVTWPRIPGATDYLVLQHDGSGGYRVVATVVASGTDTETYNIVANPAGAFTYTIPTFNETATLKTRARVIAVPEVAFTPNDTTPSVVQGNDFITVNSSATSISTFDDGINGQLIRVRVDDANSTIVHGSGIQTRTSANFAATIGLIYQFIRRASTWYQL